SHATSSSGTNWNGAAGPKGGGQEARNKVVHRPRIQSKSVFKLTSDCITGAMPSAIAPYIQSKQPQNTPPIPPLTASLWQ
ncbi:MAG: hypothetical protein KKF22_16950, partial [Gammaproteobacteria bacterium]|nr:hypothetical protein [Gammaproteobacteria bacterium]